MINNTEYIATTDQKIDWIWHLLLKIDAGVIGVYYILVLQNHIFSRFYSFYTLIININGIKTREIIYNAIYLLKYSKVGPITCIVCHANWQFPVSKSVVHLLVDAISSLFSDQ